VHAAATTDLCTDELAAGEERERGARHTRGQSLTPVDRVDEVGGHAHGLRELYQLGALGSRHEPLPGAQKPRSGLVGRGRQAAT
jgi:hypothetical protein